MDDSTPDKSLDHQMNTRTTCTLSMIKNHVRAFMVLLIITCVAGCGTVIEPPDPTPTNVKAAVEPNDTFQRATAAQPVTNGAMREVRVEGGITAADDFDIFDLGELLPGDRIVADASAQSAGLDVAITLFDSNQRLLFTSDDRATFGPRFLDALIQWTARHETPSLFLAVSSSAFASRTTLTGSYTVDITITPGNSVPLPQQQVLLLDFDGGQVNAPSLGVTVVEPFDAGAISSQYQGQTQFIKDTIRTIFEENFSRFDVVITTTDDPVLPDDEVTSSIFFGGFSSETFGIAETVDLYNFDVCDDAIIFTETFGIGVFSRAPSAEEIAIAIGNVGSHEAGHLLGLHHVDDDSALMDDQSSADAFLFNQEFKEAPLSSDIIPIGVQNAPLLLEEIVGLLDATTQRRGQYAQGMDLLSPTQVHNSNNTESKWIERRQAKSIRKSAHR